MQFLSEESRVESVNKRRTLLKMILDTDSEFLNSGLELSLYESSETKHEMVKISDNAWRI